MPKKQRGKNRLSMAIASALLFMVATFWVGCDAITPESRSAPPTRHKLGDIALKGGGAPVSLTPTAAVSPESDVSHTPVAGITEPNETGVAGPPPVAKKEPEGTAKRPPDTTTGTPQRGAFTIQIGAYIIDENLAHTKEEIVSLGFSPYVTEMKRKMKMFCVIVGEPMAEKAGRELASMLSQKGFGASVLPGNGDMVDVAGGIYYYRDDASAAEGKLRVLGYTARVEERTVEATLKCLRIGDYPTIDEAKKDLTTLAGKGFSPVILKVAR